MRRRQSSRRMCLSSPLQPTEDRPVARDWIHERLALHSSEDNPDYDATAGDIQLSPIRRPLNVIHCPIITAKAGGCPGADDAMLTSIYEINTAILDSCVETCVLGIGCQASLVFQQKSDGCITPEEASSRLASSTQCFKRHITVRGIIVPALSQRRPTITLPHGENCMLCGAGSPLRLSTYGMCSSGEPSKFITSLGLLSKHTLLTGDQDTLVLAQRSWPSERCRAPQPP